MARLLVRGLLVLVLVLVLVGLAGAMSTAGAQSGALGPAVAPLQATIDSVLRREIENQRALWQTEELRVHGMLRHPQDAEPGMQRLAMMHCHTDRRYSPETVSASASRGSSASGAVGRPYPLPTLIASVAYKTAMCPNWLPPESVDNTSAVGPHVLYSSAPARLAPFSDSLIARLAAAARAFPGEPWFLNQLVRVRTENGQYQEAAEAATSCSPSIVGWCAMLRAYTTYAAGRWVSADTAFQLALAQLPAVERCMWLSAEQLLPDSVAQAYRRMPCGVAGMASGASPMGVLDSVDARLWWLATPFFAEGVNLRLVEHLARGVRQRLVEAVALDAHHDLRPSVGGDAIAAMRARYGWPQHLFWAGPSEDKAHTHYESASNAPPFPAAEYLRSNSSMLASWRAVLHPWSLTDADYADAPITAAITAPAAAWSASAWWPREFFLHPRGAVDRLLFTQRVVLRRDTGALVFVAADLEGGRLERRDARLNDAPPGVAFLMYSPGPNAFQLLDQRTASIGSRVVLSGRIVEPGLVGIEYLLMRGAVAGARSRFGVAAEQLGAVAADRCGISDPMLLDAEAVQRQGLADIARGLLGNLRLRRPQRIGVAWESYGFRERDTVSVALRISGVASQTALQRAGRWFGLGDDPRVGLTMSWREPSPAHTVIAIDATTPILLRELSLDIATLRAGAYVVEVSMERRGCEVVRSRRGSWVGG